MGLSRLLLLLLLPRPRAAAAATAPTTTTTSYRCALHYYYYCNSLTHPPHPSPLSQLLDKCLRGAARTAVLMGMASNLGLAHLWYLGGGPALAEKNECWAAVLTPFVELAEAALRLDCAWDAYLGSFEAFADGCERNGGLAEDKRKAGHSAARAGQIMAVLWYRFRALTPLGEEKLHTGVGERVSLVDLLSGDAGAGASLMPLALLEAFIEYGACSHLLRALAEWGGHTSAAATAYFLRTCQDVIVSRSLVFSKSVSSCARRPAALASSTPRHAHLTPSAPLPLPSSLSSLPP